MRPPDAPVDPRQQGQAGGERTGARTMPRRVSPTNPFAPFAPFAVNHSLAKRDVLGDDSCNHGGISALGPRRPGCAIWLDERARSLERIHISAGARGTDLLLRVEDLAALTSARFVRTMRALVRCGGMVAAEVAPTPQVIRAANTKRRSA